VRHATRPGMAPAAEPDRMGGRGPSGPARRAESGTAPELTGRVARWAWVAALVPLVVAAGRAIADGWVPVGDSALIAVRARDVLGGGPGGDMPQLGMWASTSWSVGFDLNHPGPLLYLVLAVPAALIGGGAGLVVGTLVVNVASVSGIFLVARRIGGDLAAVAAMAVTAVLCWSFGSAVLVEPWHASTMLLPFALFALLVWAVLAGDRVCLPWAAAVGSLVLQTNLSYAVMVPVLLLAAAAVVARDVWRRDPDPEPEQAADRGDAPSAARHSAIRTLGLTAVVLAACWALPVVEQFTGRGEGNISRLWRTLGVETRRPGLAYGVRSVARVVALPPWFARPSYGDAFDLGPFGNPLPSLALSLVGLAVVAGAGAVLWTGARRRGDRVVASLLALAGGLVVLAVVTAWRSPTGTYGTIAYQMRWLWPVAAVVWLAFAVAVVRHPRVASARPPARLATAALGAVTVLAALANLPASNQGTTAVAGTYPVARELTEAVADADLTGPLHVACGEGVFDPYCEAVMAALQDDGVPFVVDEGIGIRQLGAGRLVDPAAPPDRLVVVTGDYAIFTPPGARLVTLHEGLSEDEVVDLYLVREELKTALADGTVRLDADGERVARRGDFGSVTVEGDSLRIDPIAAVDLRGGLFGTHRRDLVAMVHEDLVVADDGWDERLDRYAELQDRWDSESVAVFLEPASTEPSETPDTPESPEASG
jgi:hypothetical protein